LKLKRYTIRREVIFFLILISSLYGCSAITGEERSYPNPSWGERKKQILEWESSEKNKVDRGTLKNSEYWKQFYRKSIVLRPDLDHFLYFADEMIKVSRIFEEGKITKKQFEDKRRQLTALLAQEESRRAHMLSASRMNIFRDYDAELFSCYRTSLFLGYVNDLRKQLNAAGPQFSISHCDFFGDSIQCTTQDPPF